MRINEFGNALKIARTKAGMTQEQLAEKVGYTKQAISNWETGKSLPAYEDRLTLQDLLELSPVSNLERDREMKDIKKLEDIKTTQELELTINEIITKLKFHSPYDTTVNFMLRKLLWVYSSKFAFDNIIERIYYERNKPKKEPYLLGWGDVSIEMIMLFDKEIPADEVFYADSYITIRICCENKFANKLMADAVFGKYGEEGSFISNLAKEKNIDFFEAFSMLSRSDDECADLIAMFPSENRETSVITEFRRGAIELKNLLYTM